MSVSSRCLRAVLLLDLGRQELQERARLARDAVYRQTRFQLDLPEWQDPEVDFAFGWALFCAALVVGAALVGWAILALIRALTDRRRRRARVRGEVADRAASAAPIALNLDLSRIDALAEGGDFAEAMHGLLAVTLQALRDLRAIVVPKHLTSREVVDRLLLTPPARSALGELVVAVELTHFGDQPAAAADYQRARRLHELFIATLRGATA